jgi:hypothetical protein
MTADARKKLQFDKVLKLVRRKYCSSSQLEKSLCPKSPQIFPVPPGVHHIV